MDFIRLDDHEDVWIGAAGEHRTSKVIVIRTRAVASDDPWEMPPDARIVLAGDVVPALRRLMQRHGQTEINRRSGGLFTSSRTYTKLRKYVGL